MRGGSYRIALGGLLSALAAVVLFLGSVVPVAVFTAPAAAALAVLYFSVEYSKRFALLVYVVISSLTLLFAPDKEPAFLFALLLGYYPVLKGVFESLKSRAVSLLLKFVLFNSAVLLTYWLLINLFFSQALLNEFSGYTPYMIVLLLALGNIAFFLYDIALTRLISLYVLRIRPKLNKRR